MKTSKRNLLIWPCLACLIFANCTTPRSAEVSKNMAVPASFTDRQDTSSSARMDWKEFFSDKVLIGLIDTAIKNNLDLLATLQEIEIAKNQVRLKSGQMLPTLSAAGSASRAKVGLYTSQGAGDASAEITPGNLVPSPLNDYMLGFQASWEADVWGKLRNAKKAAVSRYLGTVEGKNFVLTNLVAEVAQSYYELLALDNQLDITRKSIELQKNGLEIVKIQKEAAVVTELAVKQFEAQLLDSQALELEILQKIDEEENKLNSFMGRFPGKIPRDPSAFLDRIPGSIQAGLPSQLLNNRPDIKQAELELLASKCDVKAARAEFYPSLNLTGSLGFDAFKTAYLLTTPQSLLYSLGGNLVLPVVNRSAIKAAFNSANAYQVEALYNYQKAILNGYVEVSNELAGIRHLEQSYTLKSKQAETLSQAVSISADLFTSARATYLEVLTAQHDALEAKLNLVEARKQQLQSVTHVYRSLGGGWH